ncbi:ribonuclease P protein component [Anaerolinea thermolimosa]|uniref:ribonuclease P protein component n=1 Tax=Anaerolinea thermolimosa TaxID=229919 RepID=UPI00078486C6|nr:ribonuclease P protein component [Anaerolinea thermolimosa]
MNRRYRLKRSTDFERVRRTGRSFPHPLVVMLVAPNQSEEIRVGVAAGRSVGPAVVRNRAKRLLRAAMQSFLPDLKPGWDLLLLARKPLPEAGYWKVRAVLEMLLEKAHLLMRSTNESRLRE